MLKGDQVEGILLDSDIKFECRLLLFAIANLKLDKGLEQELLRSIHNILTIENKRLDELKETL